MFLATRKPRVLMLRNSYQRYLVIPSTAISYNEDAFLGKTTTRDHYKQKLQSRMFERLLCSNVGTRILLAHRMLYVQIGFAQAAQRGKFGKEASIMMVAQQCCTNNICLYCEPCFSGAMHLEEIRKSLL